MEIETRATGLVVFAAGTPLAVEVEASCARAGVAVVAGILNRGGEGFSLHSARLIGVADMPDAVRALSFICPLFTPTNRRVAVAEALSLGMRPAPALVDPTAILSHSVELGDGCYVNAGAILGAATRLGHYVIVNRGASIGHHGDIDDFASIGPGAVLAGQVRIGSGAVVGAGAVIEPGLQLGEGSVLAAGAVLRRDLPPGALATGNPARIVKSWRRHAP
jgi:sugar O-acyltransferase (sialic acid O-acetyltransferase NeuD family)